MGSTKLYKTGVSKEVRKAKLTDKMVKFAEEYVVDLSNKNAAIRAGYPEKTAAVMGCKLLRNPLVKKIIGKLRKEALDKIGLERDNVLLKLSQNLNRNLWDLGNEKGVFVSSLRDIPPQTHPYIDGFEVRQQINPDTGEVIGQTIKIKLCSNASAQDMAMKFIGAYAPEKHTVGIQKPILDYEELSRASDLQAIDVVAKRLESESSPQEE